jgi:hypothetical protein
MNIPAIVISSGILGAAFTMICLWWLDHKLAERARGWRIRFYFRNWIWQRILKRRSHMPIGVTQQYSQALGCWCFYQNIYTIRKLTKTLYESGCFIGTHEESLVRINRASRADILKIYYLRQLAKASR